MKYFWLLLLALLVGACQSSRQHIALTPKPTPVLTPVYSTIPLTSDNIRNMVELAHLSDGASGLVAGLIFTSDGQDLLAFYSEEEGVLRHWRLAGNVLSSTVRVGSVGLTAVAFDEQARFLATGAGKLAPATQADYSASFNGARLWDTQSGRRVFDTDPAGLPAVDVVLSSDGRWLVEVGSGGLDVWNTNTKRKVLALVIGGEIKADHTRTSITAAAIDQTGTWIASANDGGTVDISDRNGDTIWMGHIDDGGVPLALAFNAARTRLAAVTTKSLVVWDLQAWIEGVKIFSQPLSVNPLASLVFNPDDTLLAIGTSNGWQIWSVAVGKLLIENKEPTYAVAFSPDGRLFAWGDTKGVVHIWGVKE